MAAANVFVFDAYGTLFDVHAAAGRHKDTIGPAWDRLSQLWRTKHIEYSWLYAQTAKGPGQVPDFWTLTQRSLDFAIASVGGVPAGVREKLLSAYRTMEAYPEVRGVLGALKARGARTAILSNGDPDMLADAVRSAGIADLLDAVLSVKAAGTFKPAPSVYQLACNRFSAAPGAISFQSSNRWDVAAAKAFGFRCVWINRTGGPDEYPDLAPDVVIRDLSSLPASA